MTIGLKRHYPARGRVSAGWRPRSGINNAVPSMAESLEVVRLGLGWDPLMGRRLGPSADEQRASVCACGDRFETALPRQGAGVCRMAAKIWV